MNAFLIVYLKMDLVIAHHLMNIVMMKIQMFFMLERQSHFKLFVMVGHIYYQSLSKVKTKQMKQIVNNGHSFISIIVVMVSGIISMVLMKLIVIHHYY
jgi:hypothetical protein